MEEFLKAFMKMNIRPKALMILFAFQMVDVYFCLFLVRKDLIISSSLASVAVVSFMLGLFWSMSNFLTRVIMLTTPELFKSTHPKFVNFLLYFFARSAITLTFPAVVLHLVKRVIFIPAIDIIWLLSATLLLLLESWKDRSIADFMDEGD